MEVENKLKAMGLELPAAAGQSWKHSVRRWHTTGQTYIGDLDKVKVVAKPLCMINSAPDFGQQPLVANGATDLLSQLYDEAGTRAR